MSSHHIIRDKQEPALIIANGEACSADILENLLEWSPFIVVLDKAIERVIPLGIKVDVLLGDLDREELDLEAIKASQYPIKIIHTPNQDKTDLEKAFDFLIERGFPAANVVWATGKRADHTFANITNIVRYRNELKIVLLDDYSTVFLLDYQFQKWYAKNTPISLIPVGNVTGITTKNLHYPLQNEPLSLGYRIGNSNHVSKDGLVHISYQTGDLLLMECLDNK